MAYRGVCVTMLADAQQQASLAGLPGWVGISVAAAAGASLAGVAIWMKASAHRRVTTAETARVVTQRDRFAGFHPRVQQALVRMSDVDWEAGELWRGLKLGNAPRNGDLDTFHPTLAPAANGSDPGYWRDLTTGDARVRLQMPPNTVPGDLVAKLPDLTAALDVHGVRVVSTSGAQIVLEIRAVARIVNPARLADYPSEVHAALGRLLDSWEAAEMWAKLGLGDRPTAADPVGAWPELVTRGPDDDGIETSPVGIRFTLDVPTKWSPHDLIKPETAKRVASALKVPEVRLIEADKNLARIELKVFDPLTTTSVSQLLDPDTIERIKVANKNATTDEERARLLTQACAGARITIPVGGISCTYDIPLLLSEAGDWITVNLASGAHGAVQGASRSGKSIFLNSLLAWASLMNDVRVVIIDPNSATIAPWWRTAYLVCRSEDPAEATAVLAQVNEEMKAREDMFFAARTDKITSFSPECPLYLVVVDEIPEYAKDKKFQAESKRFGAQSAKFGGRYYPAGQKLDDESLSTATRANLFDRFCFRVESRHDMAHLFEDTTTLQAQGLTAVDGNMPQGGAIVRTRSHPTPGRGRAVYLPTEACWVISDAIVAERGEVRPLPGSTPSPADAAAGGDNVVGIDSRRGAPEDDVVICAHPKCDLPVRLNDTGRPGKYCGKAHQQAHWRLRKKEAEALGVDIEDGEETAM